MSAETQMSSKATEDIAQTLSSYPPVTKRNLRLCQREIKTTYLLKMLCWELSKRNTLAGTFRTV